MNGIANRTFAAFLLVVVSIDFWSRLAVGISDDVQSSVANVAKSKTFQMTFTGLTSQQVTNAFAWAQKDKPFTKAQAAPVKPEKVVSKPVEVKAPIKTVVEDPIDKLQNEIRGDSSKSIHDQQLLTLKGIFFETGFFAVIEVTNIPNKQVSYHKVRVGERFSSFAVESINKYQIRLTAKEQPIVLSLFESDKG